MLANAFFDKTDAQRGRCGAVGLNGSCARVVPAGRAGGTTSTCAQLCEKYVQDREMRTIERDALALFAQRVLGWNRVAFPTGCMRAGGRVGI
jgi:hypothetical protein